MDLNPIRKPLPVAGEHPSAYSCCWPSSFIANETRILEVGLETGMEPAEQRTIGDGLTVPGPKDSSPQRSIAEVLTCTDFSDQG